jgi:hypothetical protein
VTSLEPKSLLENLFLIVVRDGTNRAQTSPEGGRSMLKILRTTDGRTAIFVLSGRIEAKHLAELRALFGAEEHDIVLDLKEVTLVDRDTIWFLGRCQAHNVELKNCPAYIRQWIETEDRR